MSQEMILFASIATILAFILTSLISIRRIRADMSDDIKKELTSDFKDAFVSTGYCETCTQRTCQKLDDISEKLEQGSKEFLVIRLIFMEAKLVPKEKIEEIRNTIMDGG